MSIHKIPRKSGVRYQVKYLHSDGRQRAKNFRTKREAQDFEASIRSAKNKGTLVDSRLAKITFGEYVETWIATKTNQRPRTVHRRDGILNKHLLPILGKKALRDIHRSDIQQMVGSWEKSGLAPRTIRHHIRIMNPIFEMAILDDIISKNPTRGVTTPKPGKVERHVLTPTECHALISATQDNYKPLIHIALATGLRFQELQDLTVADFDEHSQTLTVCSSKTVAGVRSVSLADTEVALIRRHLNQKPISTQAAGSPLFTSPKGMKINYRNVTQRVFKKAKKVAGLQHIGFHDLRRTHASMLIDADTNHKVVQERLGHQSILTTLALYAQGTAKGHKDAAKATTKYLDAIHLD